MTDSTKFTFTFIAFEPSKKRKFIANLFTRIQIMFSPFDILRLGIHPLHYGSYISKMGQIPKWHSFIHGFEIHILGFTISFSNMKLGRNLQIKKYYFLIINKQTILNFRITK